MSTEARGARALTRRLIERAPDSGPNEPRSWLAVQDASERACAELSLSLGLPGFHALLRRAVAQSEAVHPLLGDLRVNRHTQPLFSGAAELVEKHGDAAVAAALEAVLENMLLALGRLIGDDLVARLVERDDTAGIDDEEPK